MKSPETLLGAIVIAAAIFLTSSNDVGRYVAVRDGYMMLDTKTGQLFAISQPGERTEEASEMGPWHQWRLPVE